jgi:methionyl-tRNA formyltransferase
MKIHIITMEDPLYTVGFFKEIIEARHKDIVGLTIAKGNRLKIGNKRSKSTYLLSLFLVMGIPCFADYLFQTFWYKLRKRFAFLGPATLAAFSRGYGIPVDYTDDPNCPEYLERLSAKAPDVIINQSQFIIKKELLSVAPLGMLNRHNALLPKNRGRLTPFWVLYRQERETGVSIHFVDEGLDSGAIVVQKRFPVEPGETFRSLVRKNYVCAPKAMLEALKKIDRGDRDFLENPDSKATYNTIPTLAEAWNYRKRRITAKTVDFLAQSRKGAKKKHDSSSGVKVH